MFFELNKFRTKLSGLSFSSVRNYIEETGLFSSGKKGKLNSNTLTAIKTFSSKILSLEKYKNIKNEVEQIKTELLVKKSH